MSTTKFNLQNAINFLVEYMYVPQNKLFIESTKPTGTKHYISSANCLAASALRYTNLQISDDCISQIKSLKKSLNKSIKTYWTPVFHQRVKSAIGISYEELGTTESTWTTLSNGNNEVVCNNSSSGTINCSTESYANRAMLHALYKLQSYYNGSDSSLAVAKSCFSRALSFWDGKGFMDQIQTHYDSYKTGLGLYCLRFPELKSVVDQESFTIRDDLFSAIQDPTTGGIYGRYKYDPDNDLLYVENTFENTEATCLFILYAIINNDDNYYCNDDDDDVTPLEPIEP